MKTRLLAALCFQLPASAGGAAPKTFTLIPAPGPDGLIRGVDGRAWRMPNPAAVVAAFTRPVAICENHAGRLAASRGEPAPAFAWIERIRAEGGAIVGDVEWTPRGEAAMNAKDYRFFSPEFVFAEGSNEIKKLIGGSVLNDPNFEEFALNAEQHEDSPVTILAICAALGLATTSSETDCVTAINGLKTQHQTALNAANTPDPTKFAPREELTIAINRATTAETALATLKSTQVETEIVQLVEQAQQAGKVIPATRDHYLAMCRQEGGVERFKQLVAVMPVIAAPSQQIDKKVDPVTGAEGLTPDEIAVCSSMGLDPKAFAATKVALNARTA